MQIIPHGSLLKTTILLHDIKLIYQKKQNHKIPGSLFVYIHTISAVITVKRMILRKNYNIIKMLW